MVDIGDLEQAAGRAAAPIAQAAADRAAREIAGGPGAGDSGGGGGGDAGSGGGDSGGATDAGGAQAADAPAASPAAGGGAATAAAPVKAFIEPERGENIECLFNPAELTIAKQNQWSEVKAPGRNTPKLTFSQGSPGTIAMELTLDTTATGEAVTKYTGALLDLMKIDSQLPDSNSKTNSARPPYVVFHWGDFHSFKAIIQSLSIRFTYFAGNGTPLRAKAQVSFKQYEDEDAYGPQNPTSGTPHPHLVHQVSVGETLDRIAASIYGDPTRWRLLAEANAVVDPFALAPGTTLMIPDVRAVRRG
ncbi:MAG TPA: LysM peptidoglycan-binding domain-containing protein [Actinomycetota bacterium]|nr:LysM peptidoglycan-binding domain-containing protein [Actinomycetota bacterium]